MMSWGKDQALSAAIYQAALGVSKCMCMCMGSCVKQGPIMYNFSKWVHACIHAVGSSIWSLNLGSLFICAYFQVKRQHIAPKPRSRRRQGEAYMEQVILTDSGLDI
jgi:hypothetical protein